MTEQEKQFIVYFQENLLNKKTANWDIINEASRLARRDVEVGCPDCGRYEYYELLNYYGQLLPYYTPEPEVIEPEPEPIKKETMSEFVNKLPNKKQLNKER